MHNRWENIWSKKTIPNFDKITLRDLILANGYDNGIGSYSESTWRLMVSDLCGMTELQSGEKVLELGCGSGAVLFALNEIVKVENEIITNYELKNKILTSLILSGQEINQQNIDNLKKGVLTQLIEIKLKKIEILKYKIQKDEIRINSYLSSISNNNLQNFKNKFFENNINFEIFLDEIDTEFRWQKLIYGLYSKKINIDEEKVNDEIEKIIKQDASIDEFELSEIDAMILPMTSGGMSFRLGFD